MREPDSPPGGGLDTLGNFAERAQHLASVLTQVVPRRLARIALYPASLDEILYDHPRPGEIVWWNLCINLHEGFSAPNE